jgi:hypothetical protein
MVRCGVLANAAAADPAGTPCTNTKYKCSTCHHALHLLCDACSFGMMTTPLCTWTCVVAMPVSADAAAKTRFAAAAAAAAVTPGFGQDPAGHQPDVDATAAGCSQPGGCAHCQAGDHRVPHITRQQLGF